MQITRFTPFEELPDFLTVEEARRYKKWGKNFAYDLLRRGLLAHERWGRAIRIPKEALRGLNGESNGMP